MAFVTLVDRFFSALAFIAVKTVVLSQLVSRQGVAVLPSCQFLVHKKRPIARTLNGYDSAVGYSMSAASV